MEKKSQIIIITLIGLSALYALFSFLAFITRGKWGSAVNKKIALGTAIISLCLVMNSGNSISAQAATPAITATPTIVSCYTMPPTISPTPNTATQTATQTVTRTATRTSTVRTPTTSCYTATAPRPTATRTSTRTVTPVITPIPDPGCTCDTSCSTRSIIVPNFVKDGAGEFCFEAESLGNYINSWNLTALKINGINCTNKYIAASGLPAKISGKYYVYYKSISSSGHFEAMN